MTKKTTTTATTEHRRENAKQPKRPFVINVKLPPTLETLLCWSEARGYQDTAWTRKWFDEMENEYFWCDKCTGESIAHWPALFRRCYQIAHNTGKSASKQESCLHHIQVNRHASNWRGTKAEDIENVF